MFASKTTRAARFARAVLGAAALAAFAPVAGAADVPPADARRDGVSSSHDGMKPADGAATSDVREKGYVTKEEFVKFQEAVLDRIEGDRSSEVEFTDRG